MEVWRDAKAVFSAPLIDVHQAWDDVSWRIARQRGNPACADAEHALQFVEKRDRIFRRPIALVHEGENRNAAPLAHFKEFARLRLDALACVDDHDRGVDGGEHAIGVFAEILVAGRIEEIDAVAVVVELQNRRRNRDAALLLELHPVRRRRALIAACRH